MKRLILIVTGRVQGVGFRAETRKQARQLRLTGQVRNLDDGGVEVIAEGEEESLQQLARWCEQGSAFAEVKEVAPTWQSASGEFNDFFVKF